MAFASMASPKGVPVATTAIDNAHNAGLLAARILALADRKLMAKLLQHRKGMRIKVQKSQSQLKKFLR